MYCTWMKSQENVKQGINVCIGLGCYSSLYDQTKRQGGEKATGLQELIRSGWEDISKRECM